MTAAANVAHLRAIWRELAAQAAIDGDWAESDAAANAYDRARALHESPGMYAVQLALHESDTP
jgi:hypothetical protein